MFGIWEILGHSGPLALLHLSCNLGHEEISICFNLVRHCIDPTEGRYIRLEQFWIRRSTRDARFPNHSGKASTCSKDCIVNFLKRVGCWICSGRDLSLGHPHNLSTSRCCDATSKARNDSRSFLNPPISNSFRHVRLVGEDANANPLGNLLIQNNSKYSTAWGRWGYLNLE